MKTKTIKYQNKQYKLMVSRDNSTNEESLRIANSSDVTVASLNTYHDLSQATCRRSSGKMINVSYKDLTKMSTAQKVMWLIETSSKF